MALPEDLDALERSIRQIQIEWDKFFGGIEKKPPNDMKTRLEALIRRHANAEIRNNTERFRYQTLTARYNTLNELWSKKLDTASIEEPASRRSLAAVWRRMWSPAGASPAARR